MDCRQFLKQHSQFVDDTLSGVATWAMREHIGSCSACARHDHRVRRALLLARSARQIDVSPTFQRRLTARLAAERLAAPGGSVGTPVRRHWFSKTAGVFAAAASVAFALIMLRPTTGNSTLVMAPVVVTPPALPAEPVAAPAMFATVSSSLPVYPAMLLARRATVQFAAMHARTVSFQAEH